MSEPLDLSGMGVRRPAPAPAPKPLIKAPKKPPVAAIILVLVVAVAAGYLLFGRDGGAPATATSSARFCQLVQGLDQVAPDGPDPLSPAAAKTALDQLGSTASELQSTAPGPVRGAVSAVLGALRDAAGGKAEAVTSAAYHRDRQRITESGQASCETGPGAGDL